MNSLLNWLSDDGMSVDETLWLSALRITLLLGIAWLAQAALKRGNPRLRILLWRLMAVGLVFVLVTSQMPWKLTLPVLPSQQPAQNFGDDELSLAFYSPRLSVTSDQTTPAPVPVSARRVESTQPLNPNTELGHIAALDPMTGVESDLKLELPSADSSKSEPLMMGLPLGKATFPSPQTLSFEGAEASESEFSLIPYFLMAWGLGFALIAFGWVVGLRRLHSIYQQAGAIPKDVAVEATRIAQALGYRNQVDIRHSKSIESPCNLGVWRPRILISTRQCDPSQRQELQASLAHELAHCQGNDLRWNHLLTLLQALLWFHPGAWKLRTAHSDACDELSDAVAAGYLGNRKVYGRLLATVALRVNGRQTASALAMAKPSRIRRRIELLRRNVSSNQLSAALVSSMAVIAFMVMFCVGAMMIGRVEAQQVPQAQDLNQVAAERSQPEVLCERTDFIHDVVLGGGLTITINRELIPLEEQQAQPENRYGLSSVTVSEGGWKVDTIAIFTTASQPEEWLKVNRARLNVIAKKGDLPGETDDPRKGREVEVTVREAQDGVYELRAENLSLTLKPGEYWIGITPIHSPGNGFGGHLIAGDVRNARFDDVYRIADGALSAWDAFNPSSPGEHLSIRIEGQRIHDGQILDWPAEKAASSKQLYLRYGTFDPLTQPPEIPKELMTPDGNLWIVQCRQTATQSFHDQLSRAGATPLRYLPDDAYIVRLERGMVETVRRLESVRWIGPYHPAYRLDPTLIPEPFTRNFSFLPMRTQAKEPEGWRYVLIHLFDRGDSNNGDGNNEDIDFSVFSNREGTAQKQMRQVVEDAGGNVVFHSPHGFYLAANVPEDRLADVARCDAVCTIERRFGAFELGIPGKGGNSLLPDAKGLITLSQIRELCGAEVVKQAGGYEGLGVRVALWDDGIREDHVDLLARPVTFLGPKSWLGTNHGTPIASILCGEGRGDSRARGLLPLGGLVFATDQADPLHEDRYTLVDQFVNDQRAVVLSSSSSDWGGGIGGGYVKHYDGYSFLLDDLVLEHDLLVCEGIGNTTGSGNGKFGSWSKNALLVGGVNSRGSLRREDHRHGHFTSGPAPDGRVKPDLAHFASNVYCADASSTDSYGRFGGTSCATPLVAGHCGLMMEMWADGVFGNRPLGRSVFDRKPHAATAKALMINTAYRYSVEGNNSELTRFKQGWGMPDVGQLYESSKKMFVVNQETALRENQAVEYELKIPEGESELRVTLAYTDPLGTTTSAKALVNDLDLIVIAPDGNRYYGNQGLLDGDVSRAGGTPDRLNNVENVFLNSPQAGAWKVIVAAHRIAWDQNQKTKDWDQNFGLIVTGVEPDRVPPKP